MRDRLALIHCALYTFTSLYSSSRNFGSNYVIERVRRCVAVVMGTGEHMYKMFILLLADRAVGIDSSDLCLLFQHSDIRKCLQYVYTM